MPGWVIYLLFYLIGSFLSLLHFAALEDDRALALTDLFCVGRVIGAALLWPLSRLQGFWYRWAEWYEAPS